MKKIFDVPTDGGAYAELFNNKKGGELRVKTYELSDEENETLNEQYGDGETKYRIVLAFENDKVIKEKVQIVNVTEVCGFVKPYKEVAALIDLNAIA